MRVLLHTSRLRGRSIVAATLGALALIGSLVVAVPAQAINDTGTGGVFTPASGKLVDTRDGTGGFSAPFQANAWQTVNVSGVAGLPSDGSVGSVTIDVTTAAPSAQGQVMVNPQHGNGPDTLAMIYSGTGSTTNTVTVAVNGDGTIQVATTTNTGLVIELQGYYSASTDGIAPGGFVPVSGQNLVDTRAGTGAPKATIPSGGSVTVQVGGQAGIPADASGVVATFIAVNTTSTAGYMTPYTAGTSKAPRGLNYAPSVSTAVSAQVGLSADGKMTIANNNSTINLVIDVQGYFTAAGEGGSVFTPGAGRLLDTRATGQSIVGSSETRTITVAGQNGIPVMGSGVADVALTITSIHTEASAGRAIVWADGTTKPNTTAIYYAGSSIRSNTVIVPIGANGKIDLFNLGDPTNYVLDLQGWYANPQSPTISCPSAYAAGSWVAAIPSSVIVCTVTAPPATDSESALDVTVDGGSLDELALDASAPTTESVSVPATGGGHEIRASVTSGDGSIAEDAYGFGLGDWASGSLVASPASGGPGYKAGTLSVTPAGTDAFGSDARFKFTVTTNSDGQTGPVAASGWQLDGYKIPTGTLSIGTTYYWSVQIEGTSGGSNAIQTVQSPTYSFVATDTVTAFDGSQVDASDVLSAESPLSQADATFDDNKNLTTDQVANRLALINATYSPGQGFSADDLEFMRIYEFQGGNTSDGSIQVTPAAAASMKFSHTKTSAGVTAKFSGTAGSNIGAFITNSWSCSVTTTITKGRASKIKSGCQAQAWGAISQKPYIGMVYNTYPTATGTKSPWSFSANKSFTAFITYITVQPTTTVTTSNGQFTMNGDG